MNISVIGTGYAGLVTGACFAEFGLKVTGVDKDRKKIEDLAKGKIPIFEPGLEEIVRRNMGTGFLRFTTEVDEAIQNSLVIFIAVGTPALPTGGADLSYVDEVSRAIARNLNGYKVIVTKSTVPVGTGRSDPRHDREGTAKAQSGQETSGPGRERRRPGLRQSAAKRHPYVRHSFQSGVSARGERRG